MSAFSKIVIIVLIILSFFFFKDKFNSDLKWDFFKKANIELPDISKDNNNDKLSDNIATENQKKSQKEIINIYFLALDKNGNGIFRKVERKYDPNISKINFAVNELLKGPSPYEKAKGVYNEIPKGTKLLNITEKGNNVIIDLSSDFQYGGGTDSIYSRIKQLIRTVLAVSPNKNIYLYLDGKQADVIGGEGIMVTQPLNENSLDE